jgi:hypothetical protein
MKLQLIIDFNTLRDDCDEEDCIAEPYGYVSDRASFAMHPHELMTFTETASHKISKYCRHLDRNEYKVLIDVPDEAMFQYMLDGVYDYDYIAYNMESGKMCIAKGAYEACRYGDNRYGYGKACGEDEEGRFFQFGISSESQHDGLTNARPDYSIVPDGEHYKNIHDAVYPFVVWEYVKYFKMGSDCINRTQQFAGQRKRNYNDDDAVYEEYSTSEHLFAGKRVFDDDEHGCTETWHMRVDFFMKCMQFWMDDHSLFLSARKFISDYEIENYKRFHNKIMAQISETK